MSQAPTESVSGARRPGLTTPTPQPPKAAGDPDRLGRVAVIGGGINGLATAHFLQQSGAQVTVFEGSDQLGGLGTFFNHEGRFFERFYHVMLPTDDDLLALLDDIGLEDRPYWTNSSFAVMHRRKQYPLNGPLDLLRFSVVPFIDRLRLGWTGLYGGWLRKGDRLDDITAKDWLTRLSGRRAFARFWQPLLEAKFGSAYDQVPAAWYWARFRREKAGGKETKGYPRGGYHGLTEAIASHLLRGGSEVLVSHPVERVDLDQHDRPVLTVEGVSRDFDRLVSTAPLVQLRGMAAGGRLEPWLERTHTEVDYMGVVNVVLIMDQSVIDHYWLAVVDSGVPFRGIVESTRVLSPEETGGRHLVYLLNYAHRTAPLFQVDDEDIRREYVDAFLSLFPRITRDHIVDSYVFRTPFVEPIYSPGYGQRIPPTELVPGTVFLSTTAQIYPDVTSWNTATGRARRTVAAMTASIGTAD